MPVRSVLIFGSAETPFILPHLTYAAWFGKVYANMRNCTADEILLDYANVLAETGTCLQEAREDRELARMRGALLLSRQASVSFLLPLVVRSASSSVIVLLRRGCRERAPPPLSLRREKRATLEQIDLGSDVVTNGNLKEDILQCGLNYCTEHIPLETL